MGLFKGKGPKITPITTGMAGTSGSGMSGEMKISYPPQGELSGVVRPIEKDPWAHRSTGMLCAKCMYFCNFRCRRHAPTMAGYPAVFKTDWCGDHKLDKKEMGGV